MLFRSRIYLDYADAWAHWLGQEPGRILKTKDGAQDRVFPGAATPDDAVRKKTEPEVTDRMQPAGPRPEEEAPGETAPEETQPEAGKPDETAPEETQPGTGIWGTATPGDAVRRQAKREIQIYRFRTERKKENRGI